MRTCRVIKTQEENDKFLKRLFKEEVLNAEVLKEAFIQLKGEYYIRVCAMRVVNVCIFVSH